LAYELWRLVGGAGFLYLSCSFPTDWGPGATAEKKKKSSDRELR